ncbi:MAG TPA: hypothetical protein VF075_05445 [Pyrinomonadaceae bacterium]
MKITIGLLASATLLALTTTAFAQQQQPQQPGPESLIIKQRVMQGPEGGPPPPPDANFVFIASESFGGKVVKGAPYSAEAVTETIQTLGDGNRIVNKFTSSVFRDSEGRTRREQTLKGLGPLGAGEEPLQTIFINDPVAGVAYSLDTRSHTAHKSLPFKFEFASKAAGAGVENQTFDFKVAPGAPAAGTVVMTAPPPGSPEGQRMPPTALEGALGAATYVFRTRQGPNPNEVKEQLGKQLIEGVEADGTRTTITIPAGEIGNERAIEIVSERWYSPELQVVVMTRTIDPRVGETTYKLTNISRTEQMRSLFEVPPGYTVKEGPHFAPTAIPMARPKRPGNPE